LFTTPAAFAAIGYDFSSKPIQSASDVRDALFVYFRMNIAKSWGRCDKYSREAVERDQTDGVSSRSSATFSDD
jgi:hypothetical protein